MTTQKHLSTNEAVRVIDDVFPLLAYVIPSQNEKIEPEYEKMEDAVAKVTPERLSEMMREVSQVRHWDRYTFKDGTECLEASSTSSQFLIYQITRPGVDGRLVAVLKKTDPRQFMPDYSITVIDKGSAQPLQVEVQESVTSTNTDVFFPYNGSSFELPHPDAVR